MCYEWSIYIIHLVIVLWKRIIYDYKESYSILVLCVMLYQLKFGHKSVHEKRSHRIQIYAWIMPGLYMCSSKNIVTL